MNRFAALLDRLSYEPSRNGKLRLMTEHFRTTPDPYRGYALAALTGALSFAHAKPGLIRTLITERVDPVLFGLSYDYVGDLSETVALLWPKAQDARRAPSHLMGEGRGEGGSATSGVVEVPPSPGSDLKVQADLSHQGRGEGAPTLSDVVVTLATLGKAQLPAQLARWLDALDET